MKPVTFYLSLLALLALQGLCLGLWYYGKTDTTGKELAIVGMLSFTVLNLVFFYLAAYLSKHSLDRTYLLMTWMNFFFKILLAIGLPAFYYFRDHLTGAAFIVPFLLVYVSFTVFETWVLHQMAIMRRA